MNEIKINQNENEYSNIIHLYTESKTSNNVNIIDLDTLTKSTENETVYAPININTKRNEEKENLNVHDAEPFKKLSDLKKIQDYLLYSKNYRDHMLFILGINFGLRASDLLSLKFSDIINNDGTFKKTFYIKEKKTRNAANHKNPRGITICKAVQDAVILYLQNNPETTLDDYLFTSRMPNKDYSVKHENSNYNADEKTRPIHRKTMDRIIKDLADGLNIKGRYATHSLRKTFGYHMMKLHHNDPRFLAILQKIYGHSSSAITLSYIGITQDEIDSAYENLNLGLRSGLIDSDIS